jgi:hypothetical protein
MCTPQTNLQATNVVCYCFENHRSCWNFLQNMMDTKGTSMIRSYCIGRIYDGMQDISLLRRLNYVL